MDESLQVEVDTGVDVEEIRSSLDAQRGIILQSMTRAMSKVSWPWFSGQVATVIDNLRHEDFTPWLGKAWDDYAELREYKNQNLHPPGISEWRDMDPHRLEGMLHPNISIRCYGQDIGTLELDVGVVADIHSISLHICNGEIIGFRAGEYKINFVVQCQEVPVYGPIEFDAGTLVRERGFDPPITIL